MSFRLIYFHRLHFPSASGQTIQVIRDYSAMAAYHDVHLLYRAPQAVPPTMQEVYLAEQGMQGAGTMTLHHIPEGMRGKGAARRKLKQLLAETTLPAVVVTRTMDHAAYALSHRKRRRPIRVLLELHETAIPHYIYRENGRRLRALFSRMQEKSVFSRVDGIIATVQPQLDLLDLLYPAHAPTVLLPNSCLASPASDPVPREKDGIFRIRYAGQFTGWKNTDILFAALQNLPESFILELAGGKRGAERQTEEWLQARAEQYGLDRRLRYAGVLPPREVPAFLAGADCLVLPLGDNQQSRFFTSPMKLFEYAASGTPMVVTDQPTTRSLVHHRQEALLVAPGSEESLSEAIRSVADQPVMARQLARNARKWVEQFSPAQRAEKYNHFLATIFKPS